MFWTIILSLIVLFNIVVAFYMCCYFHKTLAMLRGNLTALQIADRRKTDGIGMSQLLILLTAKIAITNICILIYMIAIEAHYKWDIISNPLNLIWLIPSILGAIALYKMLEIKSKIKRG